MAEFKMLTHLNGTHLHVKMVGILDAVSGRELIQLLRKYIQKVSTVIIHTASVNRVQFPPNEFRNDLMSLQMEPVRFVVTGEHASLFN